MQPSLPFDAAPEIVFVRHDRARRYLIRVRGDGVVRVTVPRWGSKREAKAFAEREHAWIERQLQRVARERRLPRPRPLAPEEERALRARAKAELPPRLLELAAPHRLLVTRITIRDQKSRWGSCARSGHICLNWRLVMMPDFVRDYVMLHELMHLKRMDHSPAYWKLVRAVCPGYEEARAWLKTFSRETR